MSISGRSGLDLLGGVGRGISLPLLSIEDLIKVVLKASFSNILLSIFLLSLFSKFSSFRFSPTFDFIVKFNNGIF